MSQPTTDQNETIQQLSVKLLEQSDINNQLQQKIADVNRQLALQKQLLVQARKEKDDADLEVTRLSTEVENITQELFEQANNQVREANVDAHNIKQMNERLSNTIKEKDTTIEILQSELSNLKELISNMEVTSPPSIDDLSRSNTQSKDSNISNGPALATPSNDDSTIPNCALFISKSLSPYNQKQVYSPLYNQIRFDLPAFKLFSDSLLPHLASHLTSASELISSISVKPTDTSTTSSSSSTSNGGASAFDIRTTKFFLKLLDELDEDLKLEKAPALQTFKLRWNRKNFLLELMDKSVTIEPLSAATEAWKSQTLQKYMPLATPSIPLPGSANSNSSETPPSLSRFSTSTPSASYDPSLFKLASHVSTNDSKNGATNAKPNGVAPFAVTTSCGLCGEKRRDMNFSRLYHIKVTSLDHDHSKYDYPLCINCANKYRAVVELLKFIATIHPASITKDDDIDDYVRHSWIRYVELKSKVWYTVNIGIWNDKESYGLVYGWQNDWLTNHVANEEKIIKDKQEEEQAEEGELDQTEATKETAPESKPNADSESEVSSIPEKKDEGSETGKGWKGWSGVVAKPVGDNNVEVGIGLVSPKRISSITQPSLPVTPTKDSTSAKEDDDDDSGFEDATEQVD